MMGDRPARFGSSLGIGDHNRRYKRDGELVYVRIYEDIHQISEDVSI
jgi:hypothetical protein